MDTLSDDNSNDARARAPDPERAFFSALQRSQRSRSFVGEVDAAAAQFCRELRRQGLPPEEMLKRAKGVIHAAIDGNDVPVAERAVQSCIQHYYRPD